MKERMNKPFDLGSMNCAMGEAWVEDWCDTCYRYKYSCRIYMQAIGVGQQPELIYDENDNPICTKYKNKKDHIIKHRPPKDQEEIVFEEQK